MCGAADVQRKKRLFVRSASSFTVSSNVLMTLLCLLAEEISLQTLVQQIDEIVTFCVQEAC